MQRGAVWHGRYCGRVVKAMDLKSIGFSRAGSNPANIVFVIFIMHIRLYSSAL